jgi:hypothetical protein
MRLATGVIVWRWKRFTTLTNFIGEDLCSRFLRRGGDIEAEDRETAPRIC